MKRVEWVDEYCTSKKLRSKEKQRDWNCYTCSSGGSDDGSVGVIYSDEVCNIGSLVVFIATMVVLVVTSFIEMMDITHDGGLIIIVMFVGCHNVGSNDISFSTAMRAMYAYDITMNAHNRSDINKKILPYL